ncbi:MULTISPECIES: phospholipase D-like domain-containing protein [unclassified Sphingobium]|uniref:phospholipase D-like domain-containing protein n=1 Tax=unclassified Sphingobium TaxID=2611147 RepID=UPI002224878D|nr:MULTISPECIES: phospholipase D-like domain-containing protein [unclassified Sphingobium]MCW2412100.1 cardiolipin synthase [Sphingobium sp. B8D3D]MCW2415603.1 cardiolipin synthase [Sphingobium sp. B8D3A]
MTGNVSTLAPRVQDDRLHEVAGNKLRLMPGGQDRLDTLLDLIGNARETLDLYFYIFAADDCSTLIRDALVEACKRGAAVTLMIDAFGSARTPDGFFDAFIGAGGRFARFGARRSMRYLIRNHQKIVICDGRRAMIGGFNCENSYFVGPEDADGWCDLGLTLEGPLVEDLGRWYEGLAKWSLESRQRFSHLRRLVRTWQPGEGKARWLIGGPTRFLNSWAKCVKTDLHHGCTLDLAAAYFSPSPGIMRRMAGIAQRGSARLITPERSDNTTTVGAARHLYRRLLRAGVQIMEYQPQKLHMKLIVIDDIVYVGSANFDMRSLFINLELMLRIEDAEFARAARALVDTMAKDSTVIDGRTYAALASPFSRFRWWIDYLLVGVADYTVTRRLNFRRR